MAQPEYIQKLIDTYTLAQKNLIDTIALKEAHGNITDYQHSLLRQVDAELTKLDKFAIKWTNETLKEQYLRGVQEAVDGLGKLGIAALGYEAFSQLHTKAISVLVANTINDLTDASNFVGRTIKDSIRQAGLEAISNKVATGSTVQETKKLLTSKLIESGLTGVRTKDGRNINLASYAELVARSTTRETTNTATMNQLKSLDYDLVQMSSHATTCPVCSVYQGRVYSISGTSHIYPPLNAAFSGQHANIHPNCRHVLVPYIAHLADDPKGDIKFSNRPFDIDDRSKKEMDDYNKQQADKTIQRNNRNQYEDYKLALGKDAPKSFSGFMSIKRADGDKWKNMQSDMRNFRKEIKQ